MNKHRQEFRYIYYKNSKIQTSKQKPIIYLEKIIIVFIFLNTSGSATLNCVRLCLMSDDDTDYLLFCDEVHPFIAEWCKPTDTQDQWDLA